MAIYALIKKGKVENVIVAEAAFIKAHGAELADECIDVSKLEHRPSPGASYAGGKFTPASE